MCRGDRVRIRTTRGEVAMHVVYRRPDDDFLDPLQFRPDPAIGRPGVLGATTTGDVTLANTAGNGITDGNLLHTYVTDLIRPPPTSPRTGACTAKWPAACRRGGQGGVRPGGVGHRPG